MKELIEKLKKEHLSLLEKIEKLEKFIENPKETAKIAGNTQVYLLQTQLAAIKLYLHTLEAGIEDLKNYNGLKEKIKIKTTEKKEDKLKEKEEDKSKKEYFMDFMDMLLEIFGKDCKVEVIKSPICKVFTEDSYRLFEGLQSEILRRVVNCAF